MAINSVGYDGTINEAEWARLAPELGAGEAVVSGLNAVVLTAPDRAVRITAGAAYGHGVRDEVTANETVTLDAGSRWDTIALRRDWTTNTTSIAVVRGTGARAIAAGLNSNPGSIDDQPLYLARVGSGSSVVLELVDVRAYASKVITAPSTLALSGAPVGTVAAVNGRLLQRRTGASGAPEWAALGEGDWVAFTPTWRGTTTNPTLGGGTTRVGRYCRVGNTVHFTMTINVGTGFRPGEGTYVFGLPFPADPAADVQVVPADIVIPGSGDHIGVAKLEGGAEVTRTLVTMHYNNSRPLTANRPVGWAPGARIHISGTYAAAPLPIT